MRLPVDLSPFVSHGRRPSPGRPGRTPATAALIVAGLTLAACGSTQAPASPPVKLDTVKVERAIEQSALAQRGRRVHVSCPSGVAQQKGVTFSCIAVFRGGGARFLVTELDDSGDVHYAAQSAN